MVTTVWERAETQTGVSADPRTAKRRLTVLIAVDHAMLLDMLRIVLEPDCDIVGIATTGATLAEAAARLLPDAILIDGAIRPENPSGIPAQSRVIHLAGKPGDGPDSPRLLKAGSVAELSRMMRIIAGGTLGSGAGSPGTGGPGAGNPGTGGPGNGNPGTGAEALGQKAQENPISGLSARQKEVLTLLVNGLPMKSVAHRLRITPRTVAFHKYRTMEMLGLRDNAELIRFAMHHGLLDANAAA